MPEDRILRPLPTSPNALSKDVKQERDRNQRDSHETQNAAGPPDANTMEHDLGEQRERAGEHTAHERIRRDGAGGDLLEGIDEVVQGSLEDGKEAEAHEDGAEDRADPVDARVIARPSEEEETTGEDNGAEHHGRQTGFGDGEVVVCFEAFDVEVLVAEIDYSAEEDAD